MAAGGVCAAEELICLLNPPEFCGRNGGSLHGFRRTNTLPGTDVPCVELQTVHGRLELMKKQIMRSMWLTIISKPFGVWERHILTCAARRSRRVGIALGRRIRCG
jgi:hypothetical protein